MKEDRGLLAFQRSSFLAEITGKDTDPMKRFAWVAAFLWGLSAPAVPAAPVPFRLAYTSGTLGEIQPCG